MKDIKDTDCKYRALDGFRDLHRAEEYNRCAAYMVIFGFKNERMPSTKRLCCKQASVLPSVHLEPNFLSDFRSHLEIYSCGGPSKAGISCQRTFEGRQGAEKGILNPKMCCQGPIKTIRLLSTRCTDHPIRFSTKSGLVKSNTSFNPWRTGGGGGICAVNGLLGKSRDHYLSLGHLALWKSFLQNIRRIREQSRVTDSICATVISAKKRKKKRPHWNVKKRWLGQTFMKLTQQSNETGSPEIAQVLVTNAMIWNHFLATPDT